MGSLNEVREGGRESISGTTLFPLNPVFEGVKSAT